MNSARARRDPNEPSGSRTPAGGTLLSNAIANLHPAKPTLTLLVSALTATRKPRKKPKHSSSPLPSHPLLPPTSTPSPHPVPQPYLALAPSPVSSLSQAAIDQRAGPGQSQLVLPSSYVRGQPSGSGSGNGQAAVGASGEPSGGGGAGGSRPSTAAGQTQRKKKSARYAAGLLSPPTIVPGGSSAVPRVQHAAHPSRRAAGTPTGGARRNDGANPAGGTSRARLTDLSAINASLTSLGQLGQILESDPVPDGQAADAAAAVAERAEQRAQRRRRRIVRGEREGEGLSRRPTVTSREEGRALGLARGASMRRTNVWDDIPEGGIHEAGEPPPPFPFPTASTNRLPPAFGVPPSQRSGSSISAGAGDDQATTRSRSPPPTWEQAVGLSPIPAPLTPSPGADDPPTPRAGRQGQSSLIPPRLVIPDSSSRSRSRSPGRTASTSPTSTRYESAPSSPMITPTGGSPVEPSSSASTLATLPPAVPTPNPAGATSPAASALTTTSAEDDADAGGGEDLTEEERADRRLWNADLLAGYTLEERVRREWARRQAREGEGRRKKGESIGKTQGEEGVQEGEVGRRGSEAVLSGEEGEGDAKSMGSASSGAADVESGTATSLPVVSEPSEAQARASTPSADAGPSALEGPHPPHGDQEQKAEERAAGESTSAAAPPEVAPTSGGAPGPSPSGEDKVEDQSLPRSPTDKTPATPLAGPSSSEPPAAEPPARPRAAVAVSSPSAQGGRKLREKPKRQTSTTAPSGGTHDAPAVPAAGTPSTPAKDEAVPAIALQPATPTPTSPAPAKTAKGDKSNKASSVREREPMSPLFKRDGWRSSSEVDKVGLGDEGELAGKGKDDPRKESKGKGKGKEAETETVKELGEQKEAEGGRRLSEDIPRPPDLGLPPNREAALRRRELQLTPRAPSAPAPVVSTSSNTKSQNNPTRPTVPGRRPSPPRTKSTPMASPYVAGTEVRKVRSLVAGPLIDLNDDSGPSGQGWSGTRGATGDSSLEKTQSEEAQVPLEALAASTADLLQLLELETLVEIRAQEARAATEAQSVTPQGREGRREQKDDMPEEAMAESSAQGATRLALAGPDTPRAAPSPALVSPSVASSPTTFVLKSGRKMPPPPPPSRSKVALARARLEAQEKEAEEVEARAREEREKNSPQKRRPPPPPPPRHPSIARAPPPLPPRPSATPSPVGGSIATPPNRSLQGSSVSHVTTGETVQPPESSEAEVAPVSSPTPTPLASKEPKSSRFGFFGIKSRPRGPRVPPPPPLPRNRRLFTTPQAEQPSPSEPSPLAATQQQAPGLVIPNPASSPPTRPELSHADTSFEEADRLGIPSPITPTLVNSASPAAGSSGPGLAGRPLADRTQSDYPRLALVGRGRDGGDGQDEWKENQETRINRSASEVDLRGHPGEGAGVAVAVAQPPRRESVQGGAQGHLGVGGRGEGGSDGAREERERANRRLEGGAGVGAGLHSQGGAEREREYTDVDLFVHRLEGSGREFEGFSHLTSFLGPSKPSSASPRAIATLLPGLITVDSRRTTPQGKVKLKLSLLGVRVSKCPICLSQFKGGEKGVLTPDCGHAAHQGCALRWFREDGRCFVCREVLKEGDD